MTDREIQVNRKSAFIVTLMLAVAGSVFSAAAPQFNQFVNYTSVLQVNSFAINGNIVWVATSGGLYQYNCTTGSGTLYSDPTLFPDLNLTSLTLDSNHILWIGSNAGYLYERSPQGTQQVFPAYFSAGWQITGLLSHGRYLIIGSTKGCSVFDTVTHRSIQNAAGFGPGMPGPQVFSLAVYRDTLLLGCVRGIAKLAIGGTGLQDSNFFDPSIWTIDSSVAFTVQAIIVGGNGYQAQQFPAAMLGGHLVSSAPNEDSLPLLALGVLSVDGNSVLTLPSSVTTIAADTVNGRHRCLIGTHYNYFYFWNGSDTVQSPIAGPTFTNVTKVYVDKEGLGWACAGNQNAFINNPWWEGISVLRNNTWQVYSPATFPSMGPWGGTPEPGGFNAAVEDRSGNMWFGSRGGQVKFYNRSANSWLEYCPGVNTVSGGLFIQSPYCGWGISEGIALDSAGYLWISSYNNLTGSLLCYDPRTGPTPAAGSYRYLLPSLPNNGDSLWSQNYNVVCIDAAHNVILGEGGLAEEETGPLGKLVVLSYTGNPLTGTISCVYDTAFGTQMSFFDAAATRDSLTFLASSEGVYTYSAPNRALLSGLRHLLSTSNSFTGSDSLVDTSLTGVQTVKMQDDRYLWLGTADSGLIRYDLTTGAKMTIGMTQGLISNNVQSLAIDRKNGFLWAGTDKGVSRFSIGYSVEPAASSSPFVYPNPFSKHRNQTIVFEKLPPASKVCIYTLSGTLVAVAPVADQSITGTVCSWAPASGIVPGIYLYTIQSSGNSSRGRIIITP